MPSFIRFGAEKQKFDFIRGAEAEPCTSRRSKFFDLNRNSATALRALAPNSKRIGQQGVYTIFIATNSSWLEEDTFLRPTQALGRQIQNGQKFRKRRDSNLSATQSVTNANECL